MKIRRTLMLIVLCVFATAAGACDDMLAPSSRITKQRVLGARIAVNGDDTRAGVLPGETFSLAWLVASNEALLDTAHGAVACIAKNTRVGIPQCDGIPVAVDGSFTKTQVVDFTLEQTLTAPSNAGGKQLLIFASFCFGSDLDPSAIMGMNMSEIELCADKDAEQVVATLTIPINESDTPPNELNHQPTLVETKLLQASWTEFEGTADPNAACASLAIPKISQADAKEFEMELITAGREMLTTFRGDPPEPILETEEFQVRVLSTEGGISPPFAFIESEDDFETFKYLPEENLEVPSEGQLIRFFFTARDSRLGFAHLIRDLCLIP